MTTVLVVEDDPTLRRVIEMVLEARGYEVAQARHGAAALEQMAVSIPAIVIADLKMPVMDGRELIEHMRLDPRLLEVPVVLLTGNPDGASSVLGAGAIVVKPFDPGVLASTIERLIEKDSSLTV
jgi:CheY-like chemotaxis protein